MAIQHKDIVDPDIHTIKGLSAASANTLLVANDPADGNGTWKKLESASLNEVSIQSWIEDSIDAGDILIARDYLVYAKFTDVSTAEKILIPTLAGHTFVSARLVLGGNITAADAIVSFKNAAGSSMGAGVTIAFSGSVEGTAFSFTASANNVFVSDSHMSIETDGGSSTAQPLYMILRFTKPIP